ncbi:hypothetical protein PROVALCAL_01985 [Providencia alcalifaciens DSM 30120]|uniref:Uncharacterized protein n=1 Tax=Providencia alcalifaciens DSM 30120 TaxID=520999 RepID=B6XF53_9GAMM|nr:hypothetical protein PROVALCAL_01985 [Providencia alcalifaciens DSM 30120]
MYEKQAILASYLSIAAKMNNCFLENDELPILHKLIIVILINIGRLSDY